MSVSAATTEDSGHERLQAALDGMGATDPASLATWMRAHAASAMPRLEEAALVALWEARQDQHDDAH